MEQNNTTSITVMRAIDIQNWLESCLFKHKQLKTTIAEGLLPDHTLHLLQEELDVMAQTALTLRIILRYKFPLVFDNMERFDDQQVPIGQEFIRE